MGDLGCVSSMHIFVGQVDVCSKTRATLTYEVYMLTISAMGQL